MKAFISIFLILSHLFSTVGYSVGVHECGGKKSYSFLGISLNPKCQCNHSDKLHQDKENNKGCCTDKKIVVKGEQKEKISNSCIAVKKLIEPFDYQKHLPFFQSQLNSIGINNLSFFGNFPLGSSPPLYLLHRVFLI